MSAKFGCIIKEDGNNNGKVYRFEKENLEHCHYGIAEERGKFFEVTKPIGNEGESVEDMSTDLMNKNIVIELVDGKKNRVKTIKGRLSRFSLDDTDDSGVLERALITVF
jgi:hypothetical protein